MKKLLSVLMAVALILSLAPAVFAAGTGLQAEVREIDVNTVSVTISLGGNGLKNSRMVYTYPEGMELVSTSILLPEDQGITDLDTSKAGTVSFAWAAYDTQTAQGLLELVFTGDNGASYETTLAQPETGVTETVTVSVPYRFSDVTDPERWYYDAVYRVYALDIMDGVGHDLFAPGTQLNRATVTTVLYRLSGSPTVKGSSPFTDVPAGTWYTDAIVWASQNGIVNGYGDGIFAPGKAVTREEMAAMIYRYWQHQGGDAVEDTSALNGFADATQVASWARDAMAWCVEKDVINGTSETQLSPKTGATRAQVAQIVVNYQSVIV